MSLFEYIVIERCGTWIRKEDSGRVRVCVLNGRYPGTTLISMSSIAKMTAHRGRKRIPDYIELWAKLTFGESVLRKSLILYPKYLEATTQKGNPSSSHYQKFRPL